MMANNNFYNFGLIAYNAVNLGDDIQNVATVTKFLLSIISVIVI